MTFHPLASAPRHPVIDSPAGPDHPRRVRMGPNLALLVIVDDHAGQVTDVLIRGCWRQAPMPSQDKMAALLEAAGWIACRHASASLPNSLLGGLSISC